MYIIFIISCLNPLGKEWVAAQKIINKLVDESIGKFLAIVVVMCVVQCCSVLLGLRTNRRNYRFRFQSYLVCFNISLFIIKLTGFPRRSMMLSVYWSPILVSDFFSFQFLNR